VKVRESFPQARFQIIGSAMFGETEYEEKIRSQVARLGLINSVEFTGFRSDVPALIQKLDILVHASTTGEPFGQ
jgi:glycosyltransferase involved in cell wall biosynthesis